MTGGYEDHFVSPYPCLTLRGQSYISKVLDPENVFKVLFLGRVQVQGKKAGSDPGWHAHPWLQAPNQKVTSIGQTSVCLSLCANVSPQLLSILKHKGTQRVIAHVSLKVLQISNKNSTQCMCLFIC